MNQGDYKVSVIIPVYNQANYLAEAIESVLEQTYNQFEVLVIDDGSTDDSRAVAHNYGSRVKYIRQENRGLGAARNTGILAASGELIGLLDADDQWCPPYLKTLVALASQYPEAAVYYCGAQGMDASGQNLPQKFGRVVNSRQTIRETLLRSNFIIPSTILMRRSVVVDNGLFEQEDPSIHGCEDYDLWLRISSKHDFVGLPDCLVRYRIHGKSLSANFSRMQRATQSVIEKHFGLDDNHRDFWGPEKRRAYGGLYRFYLLSSIQRQGDWQSGPPYLLMAFLSDPTLVRELSLFYDLALGSQPIGYRGSNLYINLDENAFQVEKLLDQTFSLDHANEIERLRSVAYGTAFFALGLVAYNFGDHTTSQHFLSKAFSINPKLWFDQRFLGTIARSFIRQPVIKSLKKFR